jgi:hypothetical protein
MYESRFATIDQTSRGKPPLILVQIPGNRVPFHLLSNVTEL